MKNNIVGSFVVKKQDYMYTSSEGLTPTVTMEINSEATISDILDAFKGFLLALGYVIEPGAYLDLVEDDTYNISKNGDYKLLNESDYKGEF